MHFVFWNFLIWATVTEISVKKGVWGPVEWLGDQLTGWRGASGHPQLKFQNKCTLFYEFFWFERPLLRYLLKTVFGDQLNGLGTSWLGVGGHPEPKLKNKCTLFFEIFWFERDKRRCHYAGRTDDDEQLKIELLSHWKLEAESRNFLVLHQKRAAH